MHRTPSGVGGSTPSPRSISIKEPVIDTICKNPAEMKSEELGKFVEEQMQGVCFKLVELKPYIQELWVRFGRGEKIHGCASKNQFCERVLHRKLQTVRLMLAEKKADLIPVDATKGQLETSSPEHLKTVLALRDWIRTECSRVYALIRPSVFGVVQRLKSNLDEEEAFDLELRSITAEQVKAACSLLEQGKIDDAA